MSATVIVCTYNAPRSLDLVLAGLARQSVLPCQVIVADDGSTEATAAVVRARASQSPFEVRHLWHPDKGVQKAGIVNAGMALAEGDNLLFLDGDMVPHLHFVRDHLARADGHTVWQGRRVRLRAPRVEQLTPEALEAGLLDSFTRPFLLSGFLRGEVRNYHYAIRLPHALVALVEKRKGLMGCNFSAPRRVLEEVNGYDAGWEGANYLAEDYDLELRLRHKGVALRPILHAGVAFHLDHTPRPPCATATALRAERGSIHQVRSCDGIEEARTRLADGAIVDRLALLPEANPDAQQANLAAAKNS